MLARNIIILITLPLVLASCGNQTLSREKAKQIILQELNTKQTFPTVSVQIGEATFYTDNLPDFRLDSICIEMMNGRNTPVGYSYQEPRGNLDNWSQAAESGYLTAIAENVGIKHLGMVRSGIRCKFTLTEKAKPFVMTVENNIVTLKVVDRAEVEVTGISQPPSVGDAHIMVVEYNYKYTLNELGQALATPVVSLDSKASEKNPLMQSAATFQLYDDGWRLVGSL